jgi:hypothetical protein
MAFATSISQMLGSVSLSEVGAGIAVIAVTLLVCYGLARRMLPFVVVLLVISETTWVIVQSMRVGASKMWSQLDESGRFVELNSAVLLLASILCRVVIHYRKEAEAHRRWWRSLSDAERLAHERERARRERIFFDRDRSHN